MTQKKQGALEKTCIRIAVLMGGADQKTQFVARVVRIPEFVSREFLGQVFDLPRADRRTVCRRRSVGEIVPLNSRFVRGPLRRARAEVSLQTFAGQRVNDVDPRSADCAAVEFHNRLRSPGALPDPDAALVVG